MKGLRPVPKQYLFAYGSLLMETGDRRVDALMKHACLPAGDAVVQATLYDLGTYPGIVPSSNPASAVKGRVFLLQKPRETLRILDVYEGLAPERGGEYVRKSVAVALTPSGRRRRAWVYFYIGSVTGKRLIPGGDYLSYLAQGG